MRWPSIENNSDSDVNPFHEDVHTTTGSAQTLSNIGSSISTPPPAPVVLPVVTSAPPPNPDAYTTIINWDKPMTRPKGNGNKDSTVGVSDMIIPNPDLMLTDSVGVLVLNLQDIDYYALVQDSGAVANLTQQLPIDLANLVHASPQAFVVYCLEPIGFMTRVTVWIYSTENFDSVKIGSKLISMLQDGSSAQLSPLLKKVQKAMINFEQAGVEVNPNTAETPTKSSAFVGLGVAAGALIYIAAMVIWGRRVMDKRNRLDKAIGGV